MDSPSTRDQAEIDDAVESGLTGVDRTRHHSARLFRVLHETDGDAVARATARDGLVALHLPLVEHCARRFRNRGEPFEDLVQVGTIGLIKSIDRFDSDRGVEFSTYATPTILGEIKRYFRDKGWAIRVPRRLQELRMQITSTSADLTQALGRSPTPRELAERIGCTVEEIVEGIESSNAYATLSLDATDDSDDGPASMLDLLGIDDAGLEHVEIRESIKPLLDRLGAREKRILLLRFFKNMTQSQIAAEIGVSQMHVSRLLSRTLDQLRASLEADDDGPATGPSGPLGLRASHPAGHGASSASARTLAGCSMPASTTPAETARKRASRPDSRRFHASPSWISWVISTGPRVQPWPRVSPRAHSTNPAPYSRKKPAVDTPSAIRSAETWASSTAAKTSSSVPWITTRDAATLSGGGKSGRRGTRGA